MSIVLLLAGLAFLVVGASIVVLEARAVRSGVAASGRLVGWSESRGDSGPMYHAVVEFVDLAERRRLSESPVGSGVPLGRVGEAIPVFLQADQPDRATIASRATTFIGLFIALLGAVSCAVFFLTFRTDLFSLAASVAVTAFVGVKARAVFAGHRGALSSWRAIRDQAISSPTIDAGDRDRIAWADPPALAASIRRQRRVNRFAWPLLLAAGVGLLFLARHLHVTTSAFLARAVPGTGRVVDLAANNSSDGTTYAAVVEFEVAGFVHRFKDSLAANPPVYRPGDTVPVRYIREDPDTAHIDRGLWDRAVPLLVGLFGALLAIGGILLGARAFQRV